MKNSAAAEGRVKCRETVGHLEMSSVTVASSSLDISTDRE